MPKKGPGTWSLFDEETGACFVLSEDNRRPETSVVVTVINLRGTVELHEGAAVGTKFVRGSKQRPKRKKRGVHWRSR